MSDILVKPPQLRATARSLREHAKNIQAAVDSVEQQMRAAGPEHFQGYRAADIRQKYQRYRGRLIDAQKYVIRYAEMLEKAADSFEKADHMLENPGGFWSQLIDKIGGILPKLPKLPVIPGLPGIPWPKLPSLPDLLPNLPKWFDKPGYEPVPDQVTPQPEQPNQPAQPADGSAPSAGGGSTTPVSQDPYPASQANIDHANQAIADLDPTGNYRYKQNRQGKGETYCNIFAMDYAHKMGAPLPEFLDWDHDGKANRFLDANKMTAWLRGTFNEGGSAVVQGPAQGWQSMSSDQAATMASKGYVVIAGWENQGGIGHMAVVRPESTPGDIHIAQAGSSNFADGSLSKGFGSRNVEFFVYMPDQKKGNL